MLAVAAALIATGALAAPPGDGAAPDQAPGEQVALADSEQTPQEERKICRTDRVTGSLTRRNRICLTRAQWREVHDRTRRGVDEMVGSASGAPKCVATMDVACMGAAAMGAPSPGM